VVWIHGLHLEPQHQTFFCDGFFRDRVSWTNFLGWLQTKILLFSLSWVARITGGSHQHLAFIFSVLHNSFILIRSTWLGIWSVLFKLVFIYPKPSYTRPRLSRWLLFLFAPEKCGILLIATKLYVYHLESKGLVLGLCSPSEFLNFDLSVFIVVPLTVVRCVPSLWVNFILLTEKECQGWVLSSQQWLSASTGNIWNYN
jgi:hypothetical protein